MDLEYLMNRERTSLRAASAATCPDARRTHEETARAYAKIAAAHRRASAPSRGASANVRLIQLHRVRLLKQERAKFHGRIAGSILERHPHGDPHYENSGEICRTFRT